MLFFSKKKNTFQFLGVFLFLHTDTVKNSSNAVQTDGVMRNTVSRYRDFHFYFAHRLLHIRVLYKFVHSLHHRNTDIEPFSGLCMVRAPRTAHVCDGRAGAPLRAT